MRTFVNSTHWNLYLFSSIWQNNIILFNYVLFADILWLLGKYCRCTHRVFPETISACLNFVHRHIFSSIQKSLGCCFFYYVVFIMLLMGIYGVVQWRFVSIQLEGIYGVIHWRILWIHFLDIYGVVHLEILCLELADIYIYGVVHWGISWLQLADIYGVV